MKLDFFGAFLSKNEYLNPANATVLRMLNFFGPVFPICSSTCDVMSPSAARIPLQVQTDYLVEIR